MGKNRQAVAAIYWIGDLYGDGTGGPSDKSGIVELMDVVDSTGNQACRIDGMNRRVGVLIVIGCNGRILAIGNRKLSGGLARSDVQFGLDVEVSAALQNYENNSDEQRHANHQRCS